MPDDIVIAATPRPWGEMTDAEQSAFVSAFAAEMMRVFGHPDAPPDVEDSVITDDERCELFAELGPYNEREVGHLYRATGSWDRVLTIIDSDEYMLDLMTDDEVRAMFQVWAEESYAFGDCMIPPDTRTLAEHRAEAERQAEVHLTG